MQCYPMQLFSNAYTSTTRLTIIGVNNLVMATSNLWTYVQTAG